MADLGDIRRSTLRRSIEQVCHQLGLFKPRRRPVRSGRLTDSFKGRSETDDESTGQHRITAFGERLDDRADDDEDRADS
jgi:hypothetical protein